MGLISQLRIFDLLFPAFLHLHTQAFLGYQLTAEFGQLARKFVFGRLELFHRYGSFGHRLLELLQHALGLVLAPAFFLAERGDQGLNVPCRLVFQSILAIPIEIHPDGGYTETHRHDDDADLLLGAGEAQQHHPQQRQQEGGEGLFHHATGRNGIHADVVVDGIHLVDTIEHFLFLDLLLGHLLAAVEDAIHVEMDAHTVGKGLGRIVRCRERNPPDGGEIDDGQQYHAGQDEQVGNDYAL